MLLLMVLGVIIPIGLLFAVLKWQHEGNMIRVEADPGKGFNFGYYLFVPPGAMGSATKHLLVQPNNTGKVSDDNAVHEQTAKASAYGIGNRIARELRTPLLVPFFDRPESNWQMYTHALDSDTLKQHEGLLARIDLQLIAMINDAQKRLNEAGISVADKVLLHGFSASGNFTNRFAALHPKLVRAVVSGGVNCMPILPTAEWDGERLPFHIGIADTDDMAGIKFDLEEYRKVAQFIYVGEVDENDTLPYDDAFSDAERELVKKVLGGAMHARWDKSREIYSHFDIPAKMVMFEGVGHTITPDIEKDIIDFFKLYAN